MTISLLFCQARTGAESVENSTLSVIIAISLDMAVGDMVVVGDNNLQVRGLHSACFNSIAMLQVKGSSKEDT